MVRIRNQFIALLVASLALFATLSSAALAAPGGNSAASAACEEGGYVNWTDADRNAFKNAGQCVSYAAHGDQLVAVAVNPALTVLASALDGSPGACRVTVSVSGFPAGSDVYPTFSDAWVIDGTLYPASPPWTSPAPIVVDTSGSRSRSSTHANNIVQADGSYVVTTITAGGLSWGPGHITC